MSLTLWKKRGPVATLMPFNGDLARLRDEMDRTFDRLLNEPLIEPKLLRSEGWVPALDVSETDKTVTITAEVPGIPSQDIEVVAAARSARAPTRTTTALRKDTSKEDPGSERSPIRESVARMLSAYTVSGGSRVTLQRFPRKT